MNPPPETPTPPEWLEEVLDAISCTDGVDDHRWSTDEKGKITVELDYGKETLSFEANTDGEMHGANYDYGIYDMTDSEAVQFWCAGELYTRLQKAKEPKPSAVNWLDRPFALFIGQTYYPAPGWQGHREQFPTLEDAIADGKKRSGEPLEWWQVVDLRTLEIVAGEGSGCTGLFGHCLAAPTNESKS